MSGEIDHESPFASQRKRGFFSFRAIFASEGAMQTIVTYLSGYGIPILISAATVAAAVLVALLGNFHPSVSSHVFRIGRKPARVEVPQAHGPIVVSVRSMDRDHIWVRVLAPADAARRAEGEVEQVRPMHDAHSSKAGES